MAELRIGVSGWRYDHWRHGVFYPEGLPRSRELDFLTRRFNSLEIKGSFYSLLRPKTYERYHRRAPDGFLFAVSGSQFVTNARGPRNVRTSLANFFASGVLRLEEKLGPIVWQFPDDGLDMGWPHDFFESLPKDTEEASRLAREHDDRVKGRTSMMVQERRPLRHAVELCRRGLPADEVVRICRERNVALVFSAGGEWPREEDVAAEWMYVRLECCPETDERDDGRRRLERWAERIETWRHGEKPRATDGVTDRNLPGRESRDVFAYLENDAGGHAPANAKQLMEQLGVPALGEWDRDAQRAVD